MGSIVYCGVIVYWQWQGYFSINGKMIMFFLNRKKELSLLATGCHSNSRIHFWATQRSALNLELLSMIYNLLSILGWAEKTVCPAGSLQMQEDACQQPSSPKEAQLQERPGSLPDETNYRDPRDHAHSPPVQSWRRQWTWQQSQHLEEKPIWTEPSR